MNKPAKYTSIRAPRGVGVLASMVLWLCVGACAARLFAEEAMTHEPTIHVHKSEDFTVTGHGDAAPWQGTPWVQLHRRPGGGHDYLTQFKMLYSEQGIYVLFDGTDNTITATMQEDFLDLWTEDVFECFFWTDERHPIYFEYEISPLGYELPILIPNLDGKFLGWRPWHYEGDRKTRKAVVAFDGVCKPHGKVSGWRAEVFIPYDLLKPLGNVPPRPGMRWRGNFYRVDYDDGRTTAWDWARVGPSFHEYQNFGTIVFE
ncbi:MAG: carbohydrate-binding family 9-like protein [Pirellulaceae bacterium]